MNELNGLNYAIKHLYKDGNLAANFLARQEKSDITKNYMAGNDLPK